MKKNCYGLLLFASLLLVRERGIAQPFTMNPDITPVELILHEFKPANNENGKGRLNLTDVTQDKDTMYFFAQGFSIYSPAYASLTLQDKSAAVEVSLYKENWLKESRAGLTNEKGHWEEKFKTEGDFGIRVITKNKPVTYALVIWNGKDVEVEAPSPFTYKEGGAATGSSTGGGFIKKNGVYILLGLLVVVIVFLGLKLKKKKL